MPIEGGGAGDKQPSSDSKGQHPSHHNTGNIPTLTSETQQSPISHQQNLPSITTTPPSEVSKSIGPEQSSIQQSTADTTGHQVIAVSASKGPAAFFNLAKKFLAIDEYCDLSALEGAIVSAVDAAHLLERSKIANIVRIQTSYVPVEPKRKSKQEISSDTGIRATTSDTTATSSQSQPDEHPGISNKVHVGKKGNPLRRSRIIVTVKRTDDYKLWLVENPYHSTGHSDDIEDTVS